MKRTKRNLKEQVRAHADRKPEPQVEYEGSTEVMIPTGSTLLDLAISGGRVRGGGLPSGIMVEAFGPASSGKTVQLCEIAGGVQRQGGETLFADPEGRLNKEFARLFDLDTDEINYFMPDTIPEVFKPIREWDPGAGNTTIGIVHGAFVDSLAALTTEWEMDDKDKYGMRRAKGFSEQLRITCRSIKKKNILLDARIRSDKILMPVHMVRGRSHQGGRR